MNFIFIFVNIKRPCILQIGSRIKRVERLLYFEIKNGVMKIGIRNIKVTHEAVYIHFSMSVKEYIISHMNYRYYLHL